jgi:8-oxo-dGTP pyrophosphatase MutT (NUDIX family)
VTDTAPPFDPKTVPVRPAATVMLVRDGSAGLEVFMLQRTLAAAFARGMYVFPGGRVDDADGASEVEAVTDGLTDREASDILRIPSGGLAYWAAAIRECFEEAGVLLARDASGHVMRFDDEHVAERFGRHRHAVHDGKLGLVEMCRDEGVRLDAGDIRYVSHWITPIGEVRRFDTRFFVARAPEAQEPLHDDHETIDSAWVRPAEALDRCLAGELGLLPPTIANLRFLEPHPTADAVMAAASALGTPPAILPKLLLDDQGRFVDVVLPDDARYADLD